MKTRAQGCRCTECRRCFTPAVTAAGRQKTCSTSCRQRRRNRLARRRRQHDLEAARDDERDRQRRRRGRPAEDACLFVQVETCVELGSDAAEPGVSRAGFRAEPEAIIEETLKNLDELVRVSRAGLRRQLRRILRAPGRIRGEARRTGPTCHGPASPPNISESLVNRPNSVATTSRTGMEVRAGPERHRGA